MKSFSWFLLTAVLTLGLIGCGNRTSSKTLKVAATSVPHAELLEFIKPDLKNEGVELEVVIVEDYTIPNRALVDGDVDANFFQHAAFLQEQIDSFGYPLEVLLAVHIEPMGLYSHKIKSLKEIKEGAIVAIPSDPSNEARALELIEKRGLITLRKRGLHTTVLDIGENPQHLKFVEIDSALLARSLDDVTLAAITTNFALQAGLSPQKDALAIEDFHSDYVNVVVIRKGEEERKELQALKRALESPKVQDYIKENYKGAITPLSQPTLS